MKKSFLALALLLPWAPVAFAFPPCPRGALEILPMGNVAPTGVAAWFTANYELVGNPNVFTSAGLFSETSTHPNEGKCGDRLPVPESNFSSGTIALKPSYAPNGGFGVVVLPQLPFVALDTMSVVYSLNFTVDNATLANPGDWFDVVEIDFQRNGAMNSEFQETLSAVYRIRKTQRSRAGLPAIELIESRAYPTPSGKPTVVDRVAAVIPLSTYNSTTPVTLRWTQHVIGPWKSEIDAPGGLERQVDSILEIFGPEKDSPLFAAALPQQWASTFSMGLIDYNTPSAQDYSPSFRIAIEDTWLAAGSSFDGIPTDSGEP